MIAKNLHIKTTASIRGTFDFAFFSAGVSVPAPGPLSGAVKLDASAGGRVVSMTPAGQKLTYSGLPRGLHTYEISVGGIPTLRGHLEVLPTILLSPPSGDDIAVAVDLSETWRVTAEVGSGRNGTNGANNYELAQQAGYKGTLDEWLASLKGTPADTSKLVTWSAYNAHANATSIHVTAAEKSKWDTASTHASTASAHVSAADRAKWDAAPSTASTTSALVLAWTRLPTDSYYGDVTSSLAAAGLAYDYDSDTSAISIYTPAATLPAAVLAVLARYTTPEQGGAYTLTRSAFAPLALLTSPARLLATVRAMTPNQLSSLKQLLA